MGKRGPAKGTGGRPRKSLTEKLADGNIDHRPTTVLSFGDIPDLDAVEMPPPSEMLSAVQRDGSVLQAKEIYEKTWKWLNERGCAKFISPELIERYAMSAARWIQCEEAVNRYGMIGKHPTVGTPIQSPYVAMGQSYMKQTSRLWNEIFALVRENCTAEIGRAHV